MTTTKQTPREKAQDILERETKSFLDCITAYKKYLDSLILAIEIFGNDPDVSFGLESSYATVIFTIKDVNTTLKDIHHRMRLIGWKAVTPFNKEYLSWLWRGSDTSIDSSAIVFRLRLADNATCRKVQIGTKEVPIYGIQCEEDIVEPDDE